MPNEPPEPEAAARKRRRRKPKKPETWFPTITKNRLFAGLLFFVAGFIVAALAIRVVLAFAAKEPPTQMQAELARICDYIITAGFSSLIGLLAGRAAAPEQLDAAVK